jgi:ABC-type transport system substrate-binding protein
MMTRRRVLAATGGLGAIAASGPAAALEDGKPAPLAIQEQGSFAVGGTVITNPGTFDPYKPTPEGQTFHGDHAYVFYQRRVQLVTATPLVVYRQAFRIPRFPAGVD